VAGSHDYFDGYFLLVPGLDKNLSLFPFYGQLVAWLVEVSIFNGFGDYFTECVVLLGA